MSTRVLSFPGSDGEPVAATLHECGNTNAPVVIVAHGFKGFRDWGFLPWLAERIALAGRNALRIDFSHNGVREKDYDRLDLFEKDSWTRHQDDLTAVISGCGADVVGIVGHSRGAADAILAAGHDARVRAVCALAPVSRTIPDWPDVAATIAKLGVYPVENSRTKQLMPVGTSFFTDAPTHDIVDAARKMADRPLLVIHGDADESVPMKHGEELVAAHRSARGESELLVVRGGNHVFGAVHPFRGPTAELEQVATRVAEFVRTSVV